MQFVSEGMLWEKPEGAKLMLHQVPHFKCRLINNSCKLVACFFIVVVLVTDYIQCDRGYLGLIVKQA